MKTAISIPDDVFAEAEALTRRLQKSRSQLYTEAVREYIARHDSDATTEAMNRICDSIDQPIDEALSAAGIRLLQQVEW